MEASKKKALRQLSPSQQSRVLLSVLIIASLIVPATAFHSIGLVYASRSSDLTLLSDNFLLDTSLNSNLWRVDGPVGSALNSVWGAPPCTVIAPLLTFSGANGLGVSGVNAYYEISTIESTQSFQAPFVAQAFVMGTEAIGSPFALAITTSNASNGLCISGNLNSGNAPYYGINYEYPVSGLWDIRGKLCQSPSLNAWYLLTMSVTSNGVATASIVVGDQVLGSTTCQVGTGPFYLVLGQKEGWPSLPPGPNQAYWRWVTVTSSGLAQLLTSVGCSPNPVSVGLPTTCTATVSGSNPTGTVSWSTSSSTGSFSASTRTLYSGSCSTTYIDTSAGFVTITASYSGDANNAPSSGITTLTVFKSDFEIAVSPSTATVSPREASSFTVTVTSLNGFSSPVTLTAVPDSGELSATFSPATLYPSSGGSVQSYMDVSVLSHALASHTITVTGFGGGIPHSTTVKLTVPFLSVPYYNQGDTNWCTATSIAMAIGYYGINVFPWDVAVALKLGHDDGLAVTSGSGPVTDYLSQVGLSGESEWVNLANIEAMLNKNEPVILASQGLQHAFVVTGYLSTASDTTLYCNDPSGKMMQTLYPSNPNPNHPSTPAGPYIQEPVQWSDLESHIGWTGSWIVGVSAGSAGNPSHTPRGTLNLIGGGKYTSLDHRTVSVAHAGTSKTQSDVYIWESGYVGDPASGDTSGLTWRNSPTHLKGLDPEDTLSILSQDNNELVVNPMDTSQTYTFEINIIEEGIQKGTSVSLSLTVPAASWHNLALSVWEVKNLLPEYGTFTIRLMLSTSDGNLCDSITLPPIEYAPLKSTATTTISSQSAIVDQTAITGVNVNLHGSSAQDGTVLTVTSIDYGTIQPSGTGALQVNGVSFYDVKLSSSAPLGSSAVAEVYLTNSNFSAQNSVMSFWNGNSWVPVPSRFIPPDTVCGIFSTSDLIGTPIMVGPTTTPAPGGVIAFPPDNLVLFAPYIILAVLIAIAGVSVAVYWRRRR